MTDDDDYDHISISTDLTYNSFSSSSTIDKKKDKIYCGLKMSKKERKQQNKYVEKNNGDYILGIVELENSADSFNYIVSSTILPSVFLKNTHNNIVNYLKSTSLSNNIIKTLHIIKIDIKIIDGFEIYVATIKTFWLKILQKTYKKKYYNKFGNIQNTIVNKTYINILTGTINEFINFWQDVFIE